MSITTTQVLKYSLLPGLLPRFKDLFAFGFSHLAYFMAMIFEGVRLLPPHHPYLKVENFGRFTTAQVIVQAFQMLQFRRQNIDQILIFGAISLGVILFLLQIIIVLFTLMVPLAEAAAPTTLSQIIGINPDGVRPDDRRDDIAFMLLDRVFGVKDFFESRVNDNLPFPYHTALHAMFMTYSSALLVVAIFILTYFITTILAETVRDGTPFGKRFNKVWAVIRLVAAVGLLVPISSGLNASQIIVLTAAKWGSNFASNGMSYYYETIRESGEEDQEMTPWGPVENLVAVPEAPDPTNLIHFMLVARTCQYATQAVVRFEPLDASQPQVREPIDGWYLQRSGTNSLSVERLPGFSGNSTATITEAEYKDVVKEVENGSIIIMFGSRGQVDGAAPPPNAHIHNRYGGVLPYCGTIAFNIISGVDQDEEGYTEDPINPLAFELQFKVLEIASKMWNDPEIINAAAAIANRAIDGGAIAEQKKECPSWHLPASSCASIDTYPEFDELRANMGTKYKDALDEAIREVINNNADSLDYCGEGEDKYYEKFGWAGAAICYNSIPSVNGLITSAGTSLPQINAWPYYMELVARQRNRDAASLAPNERFSLSLSGDDGPLNIISESAESGLTVIAGNAAYTGWLDAEDNSRGSGLVEIINIIFGTQGVFNMLDPDNRDKHPMALLASAGRGLVEATIRNLGAGALSIGAALFVDTGGLTSTLSGFMMNIAQITIVAGFVLFYLVPLMPFIYYFFAVGAWIKAIFEAMVGVPLWALAHIRIDGEGLPGSAALNGYLLILEIFLRPILIFFGLLASAVIFYAMVKVLNELWELVIYNVGGFDEDAAVDMSFTDIEFWRGPIDEFFFTIVYVIVVYMIAMSTFKLIDLIPNFMLRWLGQSVEAFGETIGDPSARLSQQATIGFTTSSQQVISGAGSLGDATERFSAGVNNAKASHQADLSSQAGDPAGRGADN